MSIFNLLTIDITKLTTIISIITCVLAFIIIVLLSVFNKNLGTKTIVTAGITLALSFVLSLINFTPVTYGGAVTLMSMLPLAVFAYFYGFFPSLLVGVIYGLLQFLSSPYILTPITFILDYVLAFAIIAIIGLLSQKTKLPLWLSTTIYYIIRFVIHFLSGLIYFNLGDIWAELPQESGFIYSFLYQATYLIPDGIITIIGIIILDKTNVIKNLNKLINKR